ncbi:type I-C CRISPR-associated protein Cas5 [Candidatus Poribacteria bacterium]|jgi:CRISPR-associated protein Cas5d|nr:type I-C CRISPR-associated protein Cas5 [Candidatus Poribacteria bacterium]MBT5535626.1 type I-C CRISPR-associated protein Cas5 [Candidatus Poribacteria bacterium]MBT5714881.1 type I-C CRISPR-associated protein Cas5 [Candidatus Poribacteria bacterium]MBT7099109.1 type I-C CRISPR-associated protein Cas5 [Candidatus Poribacteria bacterium]MBT7804311.1 type I-C CRISPR-associated protein Cas5 [Candidatus Poribacteria bacterium]
MGAEYVPLSVKVWGPGACFTRPEMKVERVTYDVMTPSAARGCLEAIYWTPQFQWRVRSIAVLRPIRRFSMVRNELKSRPSLRAMASLRQEDRPLYVENDRTQRHTLALRDVAYVVLADVVPEDPTDDPARYRNQFRRRVARGQCFRRPYLGCREFAADFSEPGSGDAAIDHTQDLGSMLFDLVYEHQSRSTRSSARPLFFQAHIEAGVLHVPDRLYDARRPWSGPGGDPRAS